MIRRLRMATWCDSVHSPFSKHKHLRLACISVSSISHDLGAKFSSPLFTHTHLMNETKHRKYIKQHYTMADIEKSRRDPSSNSCGLNNDSDTWFIVGATATGKSAMAVCIAEALEANASHVNGLGTPTKETDGVADTNSRDSMRVVNEGCASRSALIINCDVMQMFRAGVLDIATNKTTTREKRGVPHLFMGFLDPLTGMPSLINSARDDYRHLKGKEAEALGLRASYLELMIADAFEEVGRVLPSFVSSVITTKDSSFAPKGNASGVSSPRQVALTLRDRLKHELHRLLTKGSESLRSTDEANAEGEEEGFAAIDGIYRVDHFVVDALAVMAALKAVYCSSSSNSNPPTFIVCGGTHYYAQSLMGLYELTDGLGVGEEEEREEKEEDKTNHKGNAAVSTAAQRCASSSLQGLTPMELWEVLRSRDPAIASRYHPNDTRRVMRCLELIDELEEKAKRQSAEVKSSSISGNSGSGGEELVLSTTAGRTVSTLSELRQQQSVRSALRFSRTYILWVDAKNVQTWLFSRQDARIDTMVETGMLKEAVELYSNHVATTQDTNGSSAARPPPSILGAIGFKEFMPLLPTLLARESDCNSSEFSNSSTHVREALVTVPPPPLSSLPLEWVAAVQQVKVDTHRYTRQQRRWVRNRLVPTYGRLSRVCLRLEMDEALRIVEHNKGTTAEETLRCIADRLVAAVCSTSLPREGKPPNVSSLPPYFEDLCGSASVGSSSNAIEESSTVTNSGVTTTTADSGDQLIMPTSPFYCEHCEKLFVGDAQILAHLNSKGHKGAVRHARLIEEQRLLRREIPPRRVKNQKNSQQQQHTNKLTQHGGSLLGEKRSRSV